MLKQKPYIQNLKDLVLRPKGFIHKDAKLTDEELINCSLFEADEGSIDRFPDGVSKRPDLFLDHWAHPF